MTNDQFATALASVFRKHAVMIRTNDESTRTSENIARALGSLADDIDKLVDSTPDNPANPPRKQWENV